MRRLLVTTVLLVLALSGCGEDGAAPRAVARSATRAQVRAAGLLRAWDERRSRAWAEGSRTALRALYLPGSQTADADVAMLERWRARGLRVRGLTSQLLDVRVLGEGGRTLRLRVKDRVVRAKASPEGSAGPGVPLPRDRPSTYVIEMVRYDGRWLVREATAG